MALNDEENGEISFETLDSMIEDKTDIGFEDIYDLIKTGDIDGALSAALSMLEERLLYEVRENRILAVQIIAVICLGSIFTHMSGSMGEYVMANGFMVTYLVLVSLLLSEFFVVQGIVSDTIRDVTSFMEAFYPLYASSVMYVQGAESAAYTQSVIILVIYLCQNVIDRLILPLIKCSGILYLVNNINREEYFSRMADLMKSAAVWGLRMIFIFVTGVNVVKSMIAPSLDRVSRNGILKTIGKMSGMSSVSSVLSVMAGTGEFIKNCMGVTCTIVLVVIAIVPMIKLMVVMFTLKCIAALMQPVGDTRYAKSTAAMADTVELCLRCCGISVLMFVISIALMTMSITGR